MSELALALALAIALGAQPPQHAKRELRIENRTPPVAQTAPAGERVAATFTGCRAPAP